MARDGNGWQLLAFGEDSICKAVVFENMSQPNWRISAGLDSETKGFHSFYGFPIKTLLYYSTNKYQEEYHLTDFNKIFVVCMYILYFLYIHTKYLHIRN